jgi:hypothetical protein
MKISTLGITFIIVGIMMIAYTGFTFVTTEKVIDIGPLQVSKENKHPIQWSPILGAVLIIGGVGVLVFDKKKQR